MNHIRLSVLTVLSLTGIYAHSMEEQVITPSSTTLENSSAPLFKFSQSIILPANYLGKDKDAPDGVLSPDGTTIFYKRTQVLKNLLTGQETAFEQYTDKIKDWTIEFRPETSTTFARYSKLFAILWDSITGRLIAPLKEYNTALVSATVSLDRSTVLTITNRYSDNTARLWDAITGEEKICIPNLKEFLKLQPNAIISEGLCSPDSSSILIVSQLLTQRSEPDKSTLHQVTYNDGKPNLLQTFDFPLLIESVEFTDNDTILISSERAASDRVITQIVCLFNIKTGKTLLTLDNYRYRALNSTKKTIAAETTSSRDKLNLWNAITGEKIQQLDIINADSVNFLAVSPDSQTILLGLDDNTIQLRSIQTGHILQTLPVNCDYLKSLAFSPDGNSIFITSELRDESSGEYLQTLTVWDLISPTIPVTPEKALDQDTLLATSSNHSSTGTGIEKNQPVVQKSTTQPSSQKQKIDSTATSNSTNKVDKNDEDTQNECSLQ